MTGARAFRRRCTLSAIALAALAPAAPARAQQVDLPAEMTLETALRIGRTYQPQLRQAQAQTEAADARVLEAQSSLLPQVTATAAYTRATGSFVTSSGSVSAGGFRSNITASQLLWDFGQAWQRRKAAKATAEAQADTERATKLSADLAIRNAFFTARAAHEAVAVAQEALGNQTKHVDQIRAFTEVGTRPQIDLLQAQADQANAELALINAQNDYATARAVLNQAMGIEAPASYQVAGPASAPLEGENGGLDALVDEAVRARPELAAAGAQVRAQELSNKATKGRFGPTLAASTTLSFNGPELNDLIWNWSGGLAISWAILEGGLVRASLMEGNANVTALRAQEDILRQQVRVDVDAARLGIAAAKAALSAADRALANARGRLELAEVRYRTGVGNGIELSDAQLASTNAGFVRVQAELRLDTARAQLQKALGRP